MQRDEGEKFILRSFITCTLHQREFYQFRETNGIQIC
jgi:hypothetical protein